MILNITLRPCYADVKDSSNQCACKIVEDSSYQNACKSEHSWFHEDIHQAIKLVTLFPPRCIVSWLTENITRYIIVPAQDSSLGTTGNSGAWLCLKPASWIVWSIHILRRKHVVHNLYFPEDECLFWQKISSRKLVLYNLLQLQPWCIDHVNFIFWILGFKFIYKLTNKKYCNLDQMSK